MSTDALAGRKNAQTRLLEAIDKREALARISRLYVAYVLECHGGVKVHAAEALDIDRRTIQRWARNGNDGEARTRAGRRRGGDPRQLVLPDGPPT